MFPWSYFCYADRSDGNKWRICKGFYYITESRIGCVTLADYLTPKYNNKMRVLNENVYASDM